MTVQRQERAARLLREEISRIIGRGLKDPRIGMVSITDVEVTPDLRRARVFVSVFGSDDEARATLEVLERATGFVRREIGRHLRLRYVPDLEFRHDVSLAHGARIYQLLDQVKRESPPSPDDSDHSDRDSAS
ncbi:MAG TPA: 30S ribosome-binding factor RbfA [Armatimonadota bacterium]|nr:30S ribosome-binding factor RbfA [Armatimonadota bacterium]